MSERLHNLVSKENNLLHNIRAWGTLGELNDHIREVARMEFENATVPFVLLRTGRSEIGRAYPQDIHVGDVMVGSKGQLVQFDGGNKLKKIKAIMCPHRMKK